jgi:hypothetical protein
MTRDHIEDSIQYAVTAENSTGRPQVALIDNLDKTAAELWSGSYKYSSSKKYSSSETPIHVLHATESARLPHWTQQTQRQGGYLIPETHFVTYAISKGLTLYVQAKHGRRLLTLNRTAKSPLLVYAVGFDAEDELRHPQPSMISMLLKAGLGPNQTFAESTVWLHLLGRLVRQSSTGEVIDPVWATVCKLLLLHGADIAATIPDTRHELTSPWRRMSVTEAIDFIFSQGSHDTFLEMREIVAAREKSTRLATQQISKKRKR